MVSRLSNGATKPRPDGVHVVAADHGGRGALEDLDDAPFGAAVLAVALDAHDDAIAVQRFLQIVRGDVDVARQPFDRALGRDEAEAGRVAVELADDEVHPIGQPVAIAPISISAPSVTRSRVALEAGRSSRGILQDAHQLARRGRMRHALPHAGEVSLPLVNQ